MYATTSLRDAYRKFRAQNKDYLYAFGQGEFSVFVLGDAHKIHELLPDVLVDESSVGYPIIKIHSAQIFQFIWRLSQKGQKVAMVARSVNANRKVKYYISEWFGSDNEAQG